MFRRKDLLLARQRDVANETNDFFYSDFGHSFGCVCLRESGYFNRPECNGIPKKSIWDVGTLVDAPGCASGAIQVQGRVNQILPDKNSLVLIDLNETDDCEDECPIKRLPVVWKGNMPRKKGSRPRIWKSQQARGQIFLSSNFFS